MMNSIINYDISKLFTSCIPQGTAVFAANYDSEKIHQLSRDKGNNLEIY